MEFFETINIKAALAHNLFYHQQRINRTFKAHYPHSKPHDIAQITSTLTLPKAWHKLRFSYDKERYTIELEPYTPRTISKLHLRHSNIDYSYKSTQRKALQELLPKSPHSDIIIIKNRLVTDTSFSNLAFFDGTRWITPKKPLLYGTMRQKLIDNQTIQCEDIDYRTLGSFESIALINAMIGFMPLEHYQLIGENL